MPQQYALADLKPGLTVGSFVVLEVYPEGRGGMARVVRAARKGKGGDQAALKISRTGQNQSYFSAAIQKEVEVLQKLDHPGVVRLVAVSRGKVPFKERAVQIQGSPWFFGMECLGGGSLEAYIHVLGRLEIEEAAAIASGAGMALAHVHARGYAHNDVKPDNILFRSPLVVGGSFDPVLIDFGVAAKLVRHQLDGSVVYMAPERLEEGRDASAPEVPVADPAKADVWSMGILLYRLLVGREPFLGVTDRSITSAILRSVPTSITRQRTDVPKKVDEFVIEGCLAKDPRIRVTMAEFNRFAQRHAGDGLVHRAPKLRRKMPWRR